MAIIMLIASLVRVVDIDVYRVNDLIILAADESPEVGSFRRREYVILKIWLVILIPSMAASRNRERTVIKPGIKLVRERVLTAIIHQITLHPSAGSLIGENMHGPVKKSAAVINPKGKKFKVGICSYQGKSFGGLSPLYQKKLKIK